MALHSSNDSLDGFSYFGGFGGSLRLLRQQLTPVEARTNGGDVLEIPATALLAAGVAFMLEATVQTLRPPALLEATALLGGLGLGAPAVAFLLLEDRFVLGKGDMKREAKRVVYLPIGTRRRTVRILSGGARQGVLYGCGVDRLAVDLFGL
jgi:hypothetical protein